MEWIVGIIIFLILTVLIMKILKKMANDLTTGEGLGCGVAILIGIALVFLFFDCVGGSDSPYDPRSDWFRWG